MAKARPPKRPVPPQATPSPKDAPAATTGSASSPVAVKGSRLSRSTIIGFTVAIIATIAALAAAVMYTWPGDSFDMKKKLVELKEQEGAWDNLWDKPNEKIAGVQQMLAKERDPVQRFSLRRELAQRYVYAGASEAAIATIQEMQGEVGKTLPANVAPTLKADLAFVYFRMGENQNCTWNHNSDACLFPVQGEGVHKQQFGMTEAAKLYTELFSDPATDQENALTYRWLLNIAHMTLGQYPDKVPKQWLIPPETFASDKDIGMFRDVSTTRGITELGAAGGLIMEDFDNDGHLDLMISHMGIYDQLEYFRNTGDGKFVRETEKAGLMGIVGGLNMVQADYDNDGCIDVFLPRGAWLHDKGKFPPSLLHNNCDGTFTDVTKKAGVLYYLPTHTAAWADVNNDGLLDLLVAHEINKPHVEWPADTRNFHLFLNEGKGKFRDVGMQSGIKLEGFLKGAVFADYDNDGKMDFYVTSWGTGNHLYHNKGNDANGVPQFEEVTAKAGVAEPQKSFTTWFFDYDNDGWPDIFVSGYSATLSNIVREYLGQKDAAKGERARLYHNNRDGTFTDMSKEARLDKLLLTMGANFGDIDNDGYLDFYLGTGDPTLTTLVPNRMFRNDGGHVFQDISTSGGFGHLQKGHGVAFGDLDGTGNHDVFEVMGGVFPVNKFWSTLYKNPGQGNHWIKLRLTGIKANRFAVGARIKLDVTEEGTKRQIYSDVTSGGSFGASSLRPHIGVGKATQIDNLEIRWPGSNLVQQFKGPFPADKTYEVIEGQPSLKAVNATGRAAKG